MTPITLITANYKTGRSILLGMCVLTMGLADAASVTPAFQAQQATAGGPLYASNCASCHGRNLDDGQFAPPLRGRDFLARWGGKSVGSLFDVMSRTMPPNSPGSIGTANYVNLLAFLLIENDVAPSSTALTADNVKLEAMSLPPMEEGYRLPAGVLLPPPPDGVVANPLDSMTPVTDAMLAKPPEADWLSWRRTLSDEGFSPLQQINKANVGTMRLAWSWALANGPNESTPLEHDGVLFVFSHGDHVQALNAVTGDLLWEYARRLPEDVQPTFKKAMSIYGERLFVATSDSHIVALDAKNGSVIWDSEVWDPRGGATPVGNVGLTGGPIIAKGKVIIGTTGGLNAGGNYVVALDALTGKEAWRFMTIPRPGEPGGDTWNELPHEKRSGASVWTPGSYDPDLNLVFFGTAQTYETGPLRALVSRKSRNNALYTDTTLAFNPDNGKLEWYFQHLPNDQWNFDEAYERQIITQNIGGVSKKVVITAGKPAIYDALEADTGKFAYSIDLGLQNIITAIDPRTGGKVIDKSKIPGDGKTKFVCPHFEGGKNWTPGSYNPDTGVLFVPLVESCMELSPVAAGEHGVLTGVRAALLPRPGSDGRYGLLQAIDLKTRTTRWKYRQRAPITMGTLATAGGLVFTGGMDRVFAAFDADSGTKLWSVRLTDVPASNAISYSVHGKQYIAVIVGNGGYHAINYASLTPEIVNPNRSSRGSSIWVFELPGGADQLGSPH